MSSEKWFGVNRDEIEWLPTINYGKCTGCLACVRKCTHGVYAESGGKPKVVKPKNCVVGCTGCEPVCPAGAISHPPQSYLEGLLNLKGKAKVTLCTCGGDCK